MSGAGGGGDTWYLEHLKTKAKFMLAKGQNTIGRHSVCRIVITAYDYVSRQHVNFIVSDTGVVVKSMNALNGVFINETTRLSQKVGQLPLNDGDRISLGVEVEVNAVQANHAVFMLKKMILPTDEEVVILSDDEDGTMPLPPDKTATGNMKNEFNLEQQLPNFSKEVAATDANASPPRGSSLVHLPKLPDVKQEMLMKTTREIEHIFGEPDEAILDSVLQLNPYVYNKLSTGNVNIPTVSKIHDGDYIEITEDNMPPPAPPPPLEEIILEDDEDDYDENMAMSQAVLQEMKDEMNDEAEFLLEADEIKEEFLDAPLTSASGVWGDEDEIILVEDDDEDLYSKVADWSSKLLTQNVTDMMEMSQAYPLEQSFSESEEEEDDVLAQMPRRSKALRIDSSSSSEEDSAHNPEPNKIRACKVRLKAIDKEFISNLDDDGSSLYTRRPKKPTMEEEIMQCLNREWEAEICQGPENSVSEEVRDEPVDEVEKTIQKLVDPSSESNAKPSKMSPTKKRTNSEAAGEDLQEIEDIPAKKSPLKIDNEKINMETSAKVPKMQERTKSVAAREDLDLQTKSPLKEKAKECEISLESAAKKPKMRQRAKAVDSREDLDIETKSPEKECEISLETAAKKSQMRQRTKSVAAREDLNIKTKSPDKEKVKEREIKKPKMRQRSKTVSAREDLDIKIKSPDKEKVKEVEINLNSAAKKPKMRQRSKTVSAREDLDIETKSPEKEKVKEVEINLDSAAKKPKMRQSVADLNIKTKSPEKALVKEGEIIAVQKPKMRQRAKSVAAREDLQVKTASPVKESVPSPKDPKVKPKMRQRAKTISAREDLIDQPLPEPKPEVTQKLSTKSPLKSANSKPLSARLLNRSKSCYMERPPSPEKQNFIKAHSDRPRTVSNNENNLEIERGPLVIDAPHLPTGRGRLRGVSAAKDKILERQRSLEYEKELKTKWYQKAKDKKKELADIKDKRKETLKKLATEKKPQAEEPQTSNKRKFQTTVPTVNNSNRGGFLTKDVEQQPPPFKMPKKDAPKKKPLPPRRATIDTFSQQLQAADHCPPTHSSRPPERREAEIARNQRTCNRVTFASMERDFEKMAELNKKPRSQRHVRFNDVPKIYYIERVRGNSYNKIAGRKESMKLTLSTYQERRNWVRDFYQQKKDHTDHMGNILSWANQWLKVRSADVVSESDVLLPIPHEFATYKQYKETFVPLMKLELLTTIERDYKMARDKFEVTLKSFTKDSMNRYTLVTRHEKKPVVKFYLYTLSHDSKLNETFANLLGSSRVAGNLYELTFQILQQDITMKQLSEIKQLTARPIVDTLRVEMGAFNTVHQLGRSPLFQRILKPCQNIQAVPKILPKSSLKSYKGYSAMNEHQVEICLHTYSRIIDDDTPSITLIQGPPGTGKSVVISNLCLQCLFGNTANILDRKILVCAHSNAAVDNITALLDRVRQNMSQPAFELLRFGLYEKMCKTTRRLSLDHHLQQAKLRKRERLTPEQREVLKQQYQDLKNEIVELKKRNTLGTYLQQELQQKEKQLVHMQEQLDPPLTPREEMEISSLCVNRANIICTTLSSCVKLSSYIDYFDICIIDEATQCTEPWTLLPLRFGLRHLVLVGDTQQLPATVISQKAQKFGLSSSLFDRIQRCLRQQLDKPGGNQNVHTKMYKLSKQYRMHPEICKWPNRYFYEDQLVNSPCTQRYASPIIPYCVINLSYTRDTNDSNNRSISNDEEARFVGKLLVELNKVMPTDRYHYGLISPYMNQCYALTQVIPAHMKLAPTTVDSYQGLERDVIIMSNARTRGCGFLTNYQRLNVALTRPKRCLIICGNFDDLQAVDMWRNLLDDARQRGVYFDLEREHADDLPNALMPRMLVKPIEI